jgi:hypothetical protein
MRFGDAADFAIEAELEPGLAPPSAVWGRMCVWAGGAALGDLNKPRCGLWEAAVEFRWLSGHLADLWDETFDGLDDRAITDRLDALLYGYVGGVEADDHRTIDEVNRDAERFSKFNFLTNWGEQFDGSKSFIVCPPGGPVRVLSRHLPARMNGVAVVARKRFRGAVEDFLRWFDDAEAGLRGRL